MPCKFSRTMKTRVLPVTPLMAQILYSPFGPQIRADARRFKKPPANREFHQLYRWRLIARRTEQNSLQQNSRRTRRRQRNLTAGSRARAEDAGREGGTVD